MKKKKKGGVSWKEAAIVAVIMTVVESVPALNKMVGDFLVPIVVIALIGWLVLRLFRGRSGSRGGSERARRESMPSRIGRKAGTAFYDGAMDWLNGKPKSQYEQEIEARNAARKQYAWHEQQAKKYAGTSDGAWHEQRMKELWNKCR